MEKFSQDKNIIEGEGFIARDGVSSTPVGFAKVEFKPSESTETVHAEDERKSKQLDERNKGNRVNEEITAADDFVDFIYPMVSSDKQYSETIIIKQDGLFDMDKRIGDTASPVAPRIGEVNNPNELYELARQITEKYPEYDFTFKTDPEGKWMKYTVSKNKI